VAEIKAAVGRLGRQTETTRAEALAATAVGRETMAMGQAAEREDGRKRRAEEEERMVGDIRLMLDIFRKQVKSLETVVFKWEDELKDEAAERTRGLQDQPERPEEGSGHG